MGLLRTLFALAVAVGHMGNMWGLEPMNGDVAVESFYIVSGFYMTMIYNEKYAAFANARRVFWLSRYLRLAPAYLLIILLTYLTLGPGLLADLAPPDLVLALASQILLVGQDLVSFLGLDTATGTLFFVRNFHALPANGGNVFAGPILLVPQGWTLGVEAWFYLLVPLIVTRRPGTILAVLASSLGLHIAGFYLLGLKGDPWTYRFFPFELAVFLMGALAYHGLRRLRASSASTRSAPWILAAIAILALCYHYLPGGNAERKWIFLVILAAALPLIFELTKDTAWDRLIGDFSYPIYIAHGLCFALLARWDSRSDVGRSGQARPHARLRLPHRDGRRAPVRPLSP